MSGLARRRFLGLAGAGLLVPRAARANLFGEGGVTFAVHGRAIRGTDVVAYHTEGRVVDGTDRIVTVWRDAMWCFSNFENQRLFEANPRAFAPQYGGYCAYAMSNNWAAPTEPVAWHIVDGRLYLYTSLEMRTRWDRDPAGNIARADANWPEIMRQLAG